MVVLAMITQVTGAPQPDSIWTIVSAIATGFASLIALGLGAYQWWKDHKRQADVRSALAGALIDDLDLWAENLRGYYAKH